MLRPACMHPCTSSWEYVHRHHAIKMPAAHSPTHPPQCLRPVVLPQPSAAHTRGTAAGAADPAGSSASTGWPSAAGAGASSSAVPAAAMLRAVSAVVPEAAVPRAAVAGMLPAAAGSCTSGAAGAAAAASCGPLAAVGHAWCQRERVALCGPGQPRKAPAWSVERPLLLVARAGRPVPAAALACGALDQRLVATDRDTGASRSQPGYPRRS